MCVLTAEQEQTLLDHYRELVGLQQVTIKLLASLIEMLSAARLERRDL